MVDFVLRHYEYGRGDSARVNTSVRPSAAAADKLTFDLKYFTYYLCSLSTLIYTRVCVSGEPRADALGKLLPTPQEVRPGGVLILHGGIHLNDRDWRTRSKILLYHMGLSLSGFPRSSKASSSGARACLRFPF